MNKITKANVITVRAFWEAGPCEGTEVVELIDDMTGKRSILIKEKKSRN